MQWRDISVLGDIISALEDIMICVGDITSAFGDAQGINGCHDFREGLK